MHVGVWHWSSKAFHGEAVRTRPSGGTETAIVHTCEALAALGVKVTVYSRTATTVEMHGVTYRPAQDLRSSAGGEVFDAFIIVRHLAALTVPVRTRCLAYWSHDNLQQPFMHGMFRFFQEVDGRRSLLSCLHLGELMGPLDLVLAVSDWQQRQIQDAFRIDPERIAVIGNGLQPQLAERAFDPAPRAPEIVYSLPPDRGLAELLGAFLHVRAQVPDAQLHVYSRSTIYGGTRADDDALNGPLYEVIRGTEGAHHHDPVDQPTLWDAMARARVYAYPTTTPETFCISLLEAQASGAVPVTTPFGAIPERVDDGVDGFLVPGSPDDVSFQKRFADRIAKLLTDDGLWRQSASAGAERARGPEHTYAATARRLLERLETIVAQNQPTLRHVDVDALSTPLATHAVGADTPAAARLLGRGDLRTLEHSFRQLLRLG